MAQKVIVILNAPVGEELSVDGIKYDLEANGYDVEAVEDTLQANNYTFQPLAYAMQEDAQIALENSDFESSAKLVDIVSRRASGSDSLEESIMNELYDAIGEGFDDEDLEDSDEDEDEE